MLNIFLFFATFLGLFNHNKNQWEQTEFIWNLGLSTQADKGFLPNPQIYFKDSTSFDPTLYANVQPGNILWIKASFLSQFCHQILDTIKNPFILVITDGDESFPSNCIDAHLLLMNEKVLHVFTQNYDCQGSNVKVSPIPIGIDFHSIAYKDKKGMWGEQGSPQEQETVLKNILKGLKPTHQRLKRAYIDFQHSDTMRGSFQRHLQFGEDRQSIFRQIVKTGLIDYGKPQKRSKLWEKKGQYAFSISPHGNGLDCHRTWEDLALGCIVIVKHSPLDPLYEGLPVVIVQDWAEITETNMEHWLQQYGDAFTNQNYREKLTNRYWLNKIKEARSQISSAGR